MVSPILRDLGNSIYVRVPHGLADFARPGKFGVPRGLAAFARPGMRDLGIRNLKGSSPPPPAPLPALLPQQAQSSRSALTRSPTE